MNYNRGEILNIDTIKDKNKAFKDFSEDSENLEKLLKALYENNIETMACCRGHSKEQEAYIKFKVNESSLPFYQNLLNIMMDINDSEFNIQNTKDFITVDIRIPAINAEYTFEKIYEMLLNDNTKAFSQNLEDSFNISYELVKLALESGIYLTIVFTPLLFTQNIIQTEIYTEDMISLEQSNQLEVYKYNCSLKDLNILYQTLKSKYSKSRENKRR